MKTPPLNTIIQGDTLEVLKSWPSDFVDCVITSCPYWGLRDYGIEGQIGLEPTLGEYLDKMLAVTAELKRVLKPTGVMFWNHGDCYGGSGHGTSSKAKVEDSKESYLLPFGKNVTGKSKAKCLALQNYRLIIRMVESQGWILRNTIVWHKPNAMPSSVKDRFSNSYEPVFMLVKKKRYWFDLDAVRVPHKTDFDKLVASGGASDKYDGSDKKLVVRERVRPNPSGKNPGDVWRIPTHPFPEAHFATFPPKLIEPMIKSSCPKWVCKKCGKARVRISKASYEVSKEKPDPKKVTEEGKRANQFGTMRYAKATAQHKTIGWTDCGCNKGWKAGIVLDPFMGSGTTALVARKLARNYLGIELSGEYIKIAEERLKQEHLGI